MSQDTEILAYSQIFPWITPPNALCYLNGVVNFQSKCYPDRESAQGDVQNLIDHIQGKAGQPPVDGVPRWLAEAFIGCYTAVQAAYNNELNAVPPPSPAQQAAIQASINQLQPKIAAIKQFAGTLP